MKATVILRTELRTIVEYQLNNGERHSEVVNDFFDNGRLRNFIESNDIKVGETLNDWSNKQNIAITNVLNILRDGRR